MMNLLSQLLIFLLDDRRYALRLSQVDRVIRAAHAEPLADAPETVLGVLNIRGRLVAVFDVRRRFGMDSRAIGPDDHFVIARARRRTVALAVDSVERVAECDADGSFAPDTIQDRPQIVTGAVQLSDGLVFIHDLDHFLSLDEDRALETALEATR